MNNQSFGASIKNIRNKKNMSLRQVEIASGGLSSSFIHNWREYPHFDKWGMNRLLKAR